MKKLLPALLLFFSGHIIAQPANNLCANATNLTVVASCGATSGQSLFQATNAGSPTSLYGTTYDVWYRFTAPAGFSSVQIALSGVGGGISNTNTFIEAYNSATCAGISTTTTLGTGNRQTGLTISDLTAGAQYYFRVYTNVNPTSSSGAWAFSICVSRPSTPGNDNCSGATALTVGTLHTTGRVTNATASSGVPVGCATGNPDDDVWYSFVASATTANITVNPNPASGAASSTLGASGAMLQLFSGPCGSLSSMTCGKRGSLYATGLTPGNTYFVRVYSFGTFSTNINAAPTTGAGFSIVVTVPTPTVVGAGRMNEIYHQTILSVAGLLNDPWEITYGPDGYLWITESKGYRVLRMDPNTGERNTVLDLSWNNNFFSLPADQAFNIKYELAIANPQGGFAGLSVHPKFLDATAPENYVYVSYVHSYGGGSSPTGIFYTNRLVRFTYNTGTGRLESPESICDTLPGSNDHNSQRMIIAPVGGTNYLFYASGDMGAGQFSNQTRAQKAQNADSYEGKILRFNLAPETSEPDAYLKWIPNDNANPQSAVWCIGIRNNQGFAYDTTLGILYGSSHGPYSDDEINIIEQSKNYGHPLVIGYSADNNYNGSSAGANTPSSCPIITSETTNATNIGSSYKDALFTAYARTQAEINNIYVTNPSNGGWPSEGWSGLDIYKHTIMPGWKNSLVVSSLKWGRLLRLKLGPAGNTIIPTAGTDTVSYFGSTNRFRDIAFSPTGKDIFVIMDRSATTSGPSASDPIVPACGGCIQKYTFLGYLHNSGTNRSTIPSSIDVTAGMPDTCLSGTTVTIDATNNNLWVPITGPDGNIMAEIKANGQNLGVISSSFYKNTGSIRQHAAKRYLDRNIRITPAVQPSSPVSIRLYLTTAEFDALDADPLSAVDDITDLRILKNNDGCLPTIGSSTTMIAPIHAELHGTGGYVLQADINSFSSFYFGSADITLPAELVYFRGSLKNNATLLTWETVNESNTAHFIVERSTNGSSFEAIGTVAATGAITGDRYSYTDNQVTDLGASTIYYRLRTVDIDGAYKRSAIVTIALPDITGRLEVFPNPAKEEVTLTIDLSTGGTAQWKLMDNSGRVVLQQTTELKKGLNAMVINLNSIPSGLYYLNVTGAGINQHVKLQKL